MQLNPDDFLKLVERANLAPSVHNTQPTRWRLNDDGTIAVFADVSRRLAVADPAGRDMAVSNGSAVEGFSIACSLQGNTIDVERIDGTIEAGLRPVARLTVRDGASPDPLASYVDARCSYRGTFARNAPRVPIDVLKANGDVALADAPGQIARLAELNDAGALPTYRDAAYRSELVSWLRLSRKDPRYALDGLNAEAMEMSPVAATAAGFIMRPGIFEALDKLGVGSTLVSEAAVIKSAQTVALLHRPVDEDPFVTGRRFYRLWLEFQKLGVSAAPMSVLADDENIRATIAHEFAIPADRRLINAFRLGLPPDNAHTRKARLAGTSLVV